MSGLSNRSQHGHGGSSASVSSAPRSTGGVSPPPSPSCSGAVTALLGQRGILQNRNHKHHNNPVTKVASKLNELVFQGLFGCVSPRGQGELALLEDGAAVVLPTGRQRSLFQNAGKDDHDDDDIDDGGIEVDTENSLRPSYELYRV